MRKTSYFALAFLFSGFSVAQSGVNVQIPPAPVVVGSPTVNLPRVNVETSTSVNATGSANSSDVIDSGITAAPPLQSAAPAVDSSVGTTPGTSGSVGTTSAAPTVRGTAGTTTSSTGAEPEIIRVNETGRTNQTIAPGDAATTRADLYISNTIRQSLVKGGLSGTARNVKVLTANGRVTLSGRVNSEAEKAKVESLARGAAGSVTVDSQLKVKGKTY